MKDLIAAVMWGCFSFGILWFGWKFFDHDAIVVSGVLTVITMGAFAYRRRRREEQQHITLPH